MCIIILHKSLLHHARTHTPITWPCWTCKCQDVHMQRYAHVFINNSFKMLAPINCRKLPLICNLNNNYFTDRFSSRTVTTVYNAYCVKLVFLSPPNKKMAFSPLYFSHRNIPNTTVATYYVCILQMAEEHSSNRAGSIVILCSTVDLWWSCWHGPYSFTSKIEHL